MSDEYVKELAKVVTDYAPAIARVVDDLVALDSTKEVFEAHGKLMDDLASRLREAGVAEKSMQHAHFVAVEMIMRRLG